MSQTAVSKLELGSSPSWPLFCRLVEAVGGLPVVTIERIPTPMEISQAIMNDETPYPAGWAPKQREEEFVDWW